MRWKQIAATTLISIAVILSVEEIVKQMLEPYQSGTNYGSAKWWDAKWEEDNRKIRDQKPIQRKDDGGVAIRRIRKLQKAERLRQKEIRNGGPKD